MTVARQEAGVNTWSWTEDLLDDLVEVSLSPERLSTSIAAAGGERERALQLYTRNTQLSAAFYGPLQGLEIALRNALHRQLTRLYGAAWYNNPAAGLDLGGLERIATAKTEIERAGQAATPSRLVAALSFGFWVSLVGAGGRIDPDGSRATYEMTLWRPALRGAFPHRRLRLSEHGVEIDNYETYLFEAQHQLQRAGEQRHDRYRRAAELVRAARETVDSATTRPDPRPAFGIVCQAVADWRREALDDGREFAHRDRKLLEFEGLFKQMFGPLGNHWPRG